MLTNCSWRTRFRLFLLTVLFSVVFVLTKGQAGTGTGNTDNDLNPYSDQPRIMFKDGHVLFETASGKNISFKSTRGAILVNGEDLANLVALAKSSTDQLRQMNSVGLQAIEASVNSVNDRVRTLELQSESTSEFTELKSKMDVILGSNGANPMQPVQVRRAIRKVARLEQQLRQLNELLTANECDSNPCRNGGTCLDTFNGFICRCTSGWEGNTCDTDVNECSRYAGTDLGCQNGATCANTAGGYSCQCATNWWPGQAKYRCICDQGWTTGGGSPACVVDVDECTGRRFPCSTNPRVSCFNVDGSFHCGQCPVGYTGDGFTCHDINECEMYNGGCSMSPMVQCTNTMGSRTCGPCPPGFAGNGIACSYVGSCNQNNGGCHPLATCTENSAISEFYRQCRCPNGYMGSGVGATGCVAVSSSTTCANSPCIHGTCIPATVPGVVPAFTCACNNGFVGAICDQMVSQCATMPCMNGGTCQDAPGGAGYTCQCPGDFVGTHCEQQVEPCGGALYAESGRIKYPLNGAILNWSSPFGCAFDFVQINDGYDSTTPLVGRYCHGDPGPIITHQETAYIWFNSDASYHGDGFELHWNATSPVCGGLLEGQEHGAINSPAYPNQYPHNRDCYWLVVVPMGKRIQFHFATVAIESHPNCSFDFLKVYDGQRVTDPELTSVCSSNQPAPVTSSGSSVLVHFHSDSSMSDSGFHITYATVPGIPGCGGLLTTPKGSMSSPNFPEQYGNSVECDWLIRVHPEEKIKLTFTTFDVESHSACGWDFVEVHNGPNELAPQVGRYCGQVAPPVALSSGNTMFVRFRADSSFSGAGFRAEYETTCGGTYNGSSGVITSPFYPDNYPADRRCQYRIVGPLSSVVRLEFQSFEVEGSDGCIYDYLEVRDGGSENGTRLGRLCGHELPEPITSRFNEIWMVFATDGSEHNKGFFANFSSIDITCGGVLTERFGTFVSPNHPTHYIHSAECHWILRAPPGFIVSLSFASFSLEPHPRCEYDYVELTDGSGEHLGRFCGNQAPPTILSRTNQLYITFKSDESYAQEGFAVSYLFKNATTACGGHYYAETGVIRSPGWPAHYPVNKLCTWIIHAADGHQVALNFTSFQLEEHSQCSYDHLEIRNGAEETSPLIGRFCGLTPPPVIISHSNKLWLSFRSDSSMPYPGFELFYDGTSSGCGGTLTSPTGSIVSPNYPLPYGRNAECDWQIKVSSGSTIVLHITDIDIEQHGSCNFDFLEMYDGQNDRAPSVGKFCNGQNHLITITSSTNVLAIKFRTDSSAAGRGFRLVYGSNCTSTLTGRRGVIESPNFPGAYPHNANCSWRIKGPMGNNLTLKLTNLELEHDDQCRHDYLDILERPLQDIYADHMATAVSWNSTKRICGRNDTRNETVLPLVLNITSNEALVRFESDYWEAYQGFRLEWDTTGCGGDFDNVTNGTIMSPNYPNGYPLATECLWHIKVPEGHSVSLTIRDFDLEATSNCQFDFVAIYNGPDDRTEPLAKICQKVSQVRVVSSTGNHMTVKMVSDASVFRKGFKADFVALPGGCSQMFTSMEQGQIMSPHYPAKYDPNSDCSWVINANAQHTVELTIVDFDLPFTDNCTTDFLEVTDCRTNQQLLKHCGQRLPDNPKVTSVDGNLCVRFTTSNQEARKGFKATFRQVCGGTILVTGDLTTLSSPNFPNPSYDRGCTWILTAPTPDEKVMLTFTRTIGFINNNGACEPYNGHLQIRDGDTEESPEIAQLCSSHLPKPIVSAGQHLHVKLTNGHFVFQAKASSSWAGCGGNLTSAAGFFVSPGYPSNYPLNSECIWQLQAPLGNRVAYNFSDFNVEQSDNCTFDYVELRDGSQDGRFIGRYCGSDMPISDTVSTQSSTLWVKFRSDSEGTGPGFEGHYELVHGNNITGTAGTIQSPGWPVGMTAMGPPFTWTITVPTNMFVKVTFSAMEFMQHSGNPDCPFTNLKVIDGSGQDAAILGTFCSYTIPAPIVSSTNVLTVTLTSPDYFVGKFELHWEAVNSRTVG
ncbi:Cubilin [Halotydeus destructor]|nr:Cubilin [Halotydeus destructor]